ncbi:MAG: hypothetical protein ACU837_09310 [Gammaproteobacteria bacterium]
MFDVTAPLLIVLLIGVWTFAPLRSYFTGSNAPQKISVKEPKNIAAAGGIPEDAALQRHCLTHFRAEIEAAFAPRPTDSILQRHHDALIAAELEKRLSELTT